MQGDTNRFKKDYEFKTQSGDIPYTMDATKILQDTSKLYLPICNFI